MPAFPFCGLEISALAPYLKQLDNPQFIGERLKKRRLQLRLPQADVAKILDVCEDSITGWENGRSAPQIQYYPQIIDFLGYNPFPMNTETLGGKIKKYRIEHGLSIKKLAKNIGVEERTLASWEANKAIPKNIQYQKLKELIS
ncbi:helix-turn-helix transcriptional regulator [uncultured Dysgonomonas sp.]|uniref:helix-turn-helix domain-containing protein n=1 Tax=uncultured Dysgonomonas sp. TaxID=206096 RepID=UPI00262F4819|nr:helix-turn-helix transcriptional regulator [uncultured Dysgonomonas sp.]